LFHCPLSVPLDKAFLCQSAELGYPLAQAETGARLDGEEKFLFAKTAASQLEREGFFWLGQCYEYGGCCEKDLDKAREVFLIAAQLGCVFSMRDLGALLERSDPQRWFWWGRAAVFGDTYLFLFNFSGPVHKFESGSRNGAVVFQIGNALTGRIRVEKRTIFDQTCDFDSFIGPANSAISFYKSQLSACRRAVDTWSHVGIRCGVVKDIRILIGKCVWETRDLALFGIEPNPKLSEAVALFKIEPILPVELAESEAIAPKKKKACVCF
jgi:hypothetical protein